MMRAGHKKHNGHASPLKSALLNTSLRLITGMSLWIAGTSLAAASDFMFDLDNTGTTPVSVQVTIHQLTPDTLRFTVNQNDPNSYGDLRYLFLQVNEDEIDLFDLDFSFVSAVHNETGNFFTPDFGITAGFNSVGMSDSKYYDIAFEFGLSGTGQIKDKDKKKRKRKKKPPKKTGLSDDIRSFTFDITNTAGSLNQMSFLATDTQYFMAARVTSSWDGVDRGGSSKLECCGTTTVAAPESTLSMLALAFGGLLWRRKTSS